MISNYLVNTAEAPTAPQLPLLFFVKSRRRQIVLPAVISICYLTAIAIFARGIHNAATLRHWWAIVLFASLVLFFSLFFVAVIYAAFQMMKPGPVLIVYEDGIYYRIASEKIIPWSQISRMWKKLWPTGDSDICFELATDAQSRRNLRLFWRTTSKLGWLMGPGTFSISFGGLSCDTRPAISCIFARVKAANPQVHIHLM